MRSTGRGTLCIRYFMSLLGRNRFESLVRPCALLLQHCPSISRGRSRRTATDDFP